MNEMKGRTSQPAPSPLIPPPTSRGDASRDERSRLGDHILAPPTSRGGGTLRETKGVDLAIIFGLPFPNKPGRGWGWGRICGVVIYTV